MKISITLPSIYPHCLSRALKNLRDATRYPYKVIVVSPFEPENIVAPHGELKWIKDDSGKGCNAAHAQGIRYAEGDFIIPWVDDHFLADGWDVVSIEDFESRSASRDFFVLGLRQAYPLQVGITFGLYYPYFPLMRLADARRIGWYDSAFQMDFADVDLGMRIWNDGGFIEWSSHTVISVHSDDQRKDGREFCAEDMRIFLSRWKATLGSKFKTADLRDFNVDIDTTTLDAEQRTITP